MAAMFLMTVETLIPIFTKEDMKELYIYMALLFIFVFMSLIAVIGISADRPGLILPFVLWYFIHVFIVVCLDIHSVVSGEYHIYNNDDRTAKDTARLMLRLLMFSFYMYLIALFYSLYISTIQRRNQIDAEENATEVDDYDVEEEEEKPKIVRV